MRVDEIRHPVMSEQAVAGGEVLAQSREFSVGR
jgi:hypothetical protein